MATDKRRLHLYVTAPLADRGVAVVKRLPGVTLSGLVDEYLGMMVPLLEDLAEAVEAGDYEAMKTAFAGAIGGAFLHTMLDEEVIDT